MKERKKILIVDDDDMIRLLLRNLLEGEFDLEEASSGEEGVMQYKETHPDLVVMDMILGGITGLEASKQILAFDSFAKILVLTAHADREFRQAAFVAGVMSYMVKPFDHALFLKEVNRALSVEVTC